MTVIATERAGDPARFLAALAQTLATMSLYDEGHPARGRAADAAFEALRVLQRGDPTPRFSFLGTNAIYNERSLRSLRDWEWAQRLGKAGIQRMEFRADVEIDEFRVFLDRILARVATVQSGGGTAQAASSDESGAGSPIRFGAVGVRGMSTVPTPARAGSVSGSQLWDLSGEADTVKWMHDEVREREGLPLAEAEAVVSALTVAMHGDNQIILPLLQLKEFDQYTTTHALNVAVLAMGLAEYLELSGREIRAFGVAGLLHDLGKVRVPMEILGKPGKLTDPEFEVMRQHPVHGARIILESDRNLDLAAVVAFEHHIMIDGGGYPQRYCRRDCHHASVLVHLCDVYDALRTRRPYRDGWEAEAALSYIERGVGTEFDPDAGHAFVAMMRQWEERPATMTRDPAAL